jgi:hypothetical protein
MRWATRRHCHVDRAACAWLVVRFIDPDAEFVFVNDPDDVPADATPFDMRGAEFGHHQDRCSFESFLSHYDLDEPALTDIGRIVHEADLGDDLYDAPEAPGLDRLIRGMSLIAADDDELLAMTPPLFDSLYALLRRSHLHEEPGDRL